MTFDVPMPVSVVSDRFTAMGTRAEAHLFDAPAGPDAILLVRRAVARAEATLTIHRPSPTTALNERLARGEAAAVDDPILLDALETAEALWRRTNGLFDPTAGAFPGAGGGGFGHLGFDARTARVRPETPSRLDFGGLGKGLALDHAATALRAAGVVAGLISLGESSILALGSHPHGEGWRLGVPHPEHGGYFLQELTLREEALSISATGDRRAAVDRAPTVRPETGEPILTAMTAVAVDRSAATAEAFSTAMLVATAEEREALVLAASEPTRLFIHVFDPVPTAVRVLA